MNTFAKFMLVGAATAAVYLGLMSVLYGRFHLDYRIAVTVCYIIAVALHFLLNRHLTFRTGNGHVMLQIMKYLALVAINYLVTMLVVAGAVAWVGLSPYLGALLAIVSTTIVTFVMSKNWVFRSIETDCGR